MARLEWNDHVARRSLYMEEYVSDANNIGTVYIWGLKAPNIITQYITQADTGEAFVIYGKIPDSKSVSLYVFSVTVSVSTTTNIY